MNAISFGISGGPDGLVVLLLILPTVFWIWTIVDCSKHESAEGSDRLVWLIVIILIGIIGSLTYCFVRRPARIREHRLQTDGEDDSKNALC
ncbi:PLDc N-terminal domain-containing protein [Pontiella agarivorans]|uniref:PLDc N-terminal domain-containing protein n=1 Tax=Pontiella agarivorans TaxID=3038953 RepID=A0ABU5MVX6_9BACT|nr:PLDc N-terminal domain-containing protein [Pontiella agarivorans]MDZ8118320.1 PLDc N-terminal domain-containing protein [Pontiella agarivorans]